MMEKSNNQTAEVPSTGAVTARAIFSAGVFGAIGMWLGKWLGERGNAPDRQMAKPIMKWGMGGFWALVAAYSSLKASEQETKAASHPEGPITYEPSRIEPSLATTENDTVPVNSVEAATIAADGKAAAKEPMVLQV